MTDLLEDIAREHDIPVSHGDARIGYEPDTNATRNR